MNNDELIHRILTGNFNKDEHRQFNNLIKSDQQVREEVFTYMLLEGEFTARYNPPFRFKPLEQTGPALFIRRYKFFMAAASLLIVIIGALVIFYRDNKSKIPIVAQPPIKSEKPYWQFEEIKQTSMSSSKPLQIAGGPLVEERGDRGGFGGPVGAPGQEDGKELANAINLFSKQFAFKVILPKNLPDDLYFAKAKRIAPDINKVETAMLVYNAENRSLVIFEDENVNKIDSVPKNMPEGTQWEQQIYGNLRITIIGNGFKAEEWKSLVEKINF